MIKADRVSNKKDFVSVVLMILCLITLADARALLAPYILAACFGVFCLVRNRSCAPDKKTWKYRLMTAFSVITAVLITLANYEMWYRPALPDIRTATFVRIYKALVIAILMSGSFVCAQNILRYALYPPEGTARTSEDKPVKRAYLFFIIPFAIFTGIYLTVFFSCYYPGLLSLDSMDQVAQVFTGQYSNHQPFYHTMIIQAFLNAGLAMFSDINMAVAFYSIVQVVIMCATFSFVLFNMAKMGAPKWGLVCATLYYALMPFHIMFSYTMWKDVYFGAMVCLLIVFFIRLIKNIGNRYASLTGFALCGIVMCLIRSNGLFAYIFVFITCIILIRKDKAVLIIMAATIVAAFVCKHAVLSGLNVVQPDTVESLSIPLQQVARVVADGGVITDSDREIMEQIIDVDAIKDNYDPIISDPIKNMIRDYGNQDYLTGNKAEYALLYLRVIARNPAPAVFAWVDSTCGYWNSGYNYWVWYWDVESNQYGIERTISSPAVLNFMDEYLWMFYNNRILQLFTSIGLFVWIVVFMFARNIATDNRAGLVAIMPILAILVTLVISSPVFAEFRYMYSMFASLPALIAVTFTGRSDKTQAQ